MKSVSKTLWVAVAVVLLLLAVATFEQIFVARSQTMNGAEQQVARLNMVFAEQTGRAVETVNLILRDVEEQFQSGAGSWPSDAAAATNFLHTRIEGVRQVMAIAVIDPNGHVLFASQDPASLPALTPRLRMQHFLPLANFGSHLPCGPQTRPGR